MKHHTALMLAASMALALPAFAQPTCAPRYPPPTTIAAMFDMAAVTSDTLDALAGVDVAIAARGGQDLSKYGLRHSHLAFLVRNDNGSWDVVHLLNRCKSDTSNLYREGLVNLVGESSITTDLRVGIPTPAVREALKALLGGAAPQARVLHEPRYSMLAYPGSTEFQNSNQWILEVAAAAMARSADGTTLADRKAVLDWLKHNGYTPTRMHIGIGKRLGARFFADNVAVTDHPASERISGNYSVVTVESVFDFLHRSGALERELSIPHQVPVPAIVGAVSTAQPKESTP
ncbi:DUF2145 domain-containing protein [Stenotrophomonas sp. SY1]|uniref:DUF2145 domain-containing protein n=1 Tax=Stenotrophomonas sp. SY1 TaxID=477235 RepID=UPI001E3ABF88|nr:DUF2145 domain-containing protein [Stenotrophomonas sp. SY1]MCD9088284.1 DUF2145 domain-containing protein [Stenotrophomonas sp. SY1]